MKNNLGRVKYPYLSKFIKAVFSLNHGQADVERGFSINCHYVTTSCTSLNEKTIDSLRAVEEEIRSRGGDVTKFLIFPKMLKYFSEAHKMYKEYLEENKKEKEIEALNLKCNDELKSLEVKKERLQQTVDSIHSLISKANTRLTKAVQSTNMVKICSEQALLESGHRILIDKGEEFKKK